MALAQNATVFVVAPAAPETSRPPGHSLGHADLSKTIRKPNAVNFSRSYDPHRQRQCSATSPASRLTRMPKACSDVSPMANLHLCRGIRLCFILFLPMPFPPAQGVWRYAPVSSCALCARINSSDSHLPVGWPALPNDDVSLRVDYLARDGGFPGYGLNYTPERVALLTVTIPSLVRLVLSPFWGRLFDGMNFRSTRDPESLFWRGHSRLLRFG